MPRSKKRDAMPRHFKGIDQAAEFWDRHDLADYWDLTREAHFKINLKSRVFLTAVEPKLAKKLTSVAKKQGLSTETLINVWLAEKIKEAA